MQIIINVSKQRTNTQKSYLALAVIALAICLVAAQDYDDDGYSGGGQGNDGYGGFSGGDDDYAAPRDTAATGNEGSDHNAGYQPHGGSSEADNDAGYDGDDVAAAASNSKPSLVRMLNRAR